MTIRTVSWSLSVAVGLSGFLMAPHAFKTREPQVLDLPTHVSSSQAVVESRLSADSVWEFGLFRFDRLAPAARYGSVVTKESHPTVSAGRPRWVLTGIVEGATGVALFEGIPDSGGVTMAVTVGDTLGVYHIEAIERDSVSVASGDSLWTFVVGVH